MKNIFHAPVIQTVKRYIVAHKIISGIILLVVLVGGYNVVRGMTSTTSDPRYLTALVGRDTLISTITGSGQVSTSDSIDIKPKVSGDQITWIGVTPGQVVHAGQALMSIDSTDAKRAVTNAEQTLVTAQLQYQKDSASAPIDYQNTQDSLTTAQDDLATTYNDTFNSLSTTYLDLPNIMNGSSNILYGYDLSSTKTQTNADAINSLYINNENQPERLKLASFVQQAESDLTTAQTQYNASVLTYKSATRNSSSDVISSLLTQSIGTMTSVTQALQSELNMLGVLTDVSTAYNLKLPSAVSTMQTNARSYLTNANTDLSNLLAQKKAIDSANQTIKTDQQNIALMQVGNTDGSNPISLQIEKNNLVTQQQNLDQLKQDLADYTIVAPFDGTISAVPAKVGDTAGASAVASIITNQAIAEISLNEVDVSKIQLGDKVDLTFDAIDGLTITGKVVQIDTVGTVSQGVVTYGVKINFDTQDMRVKSGMSVNASVITQVKPDVLVVPNSAVKTQNGVSTVQVFNPPLPADTTGQGIVSAVPPQQVQVQIGDANDTETEIIGGVTEGEQIVTRTVAASTKTTATTSSTPSLFGSTGARGAATGGATFRATTGVTGR